MANPYINKVVIDGVSKIDLTGDTVSPGVLLEGATAHDKSGAPIVGTVTSGTEGTPVATKGTVSNHSIVVTPSVENTAGIISGGKKTGSAVTVSASELVSGSETKTSNGSYDVTNLETLVVSIPVYDGSVT